MYPILQDAQIRKAVCDAILAADIDSAISVIDQSAPTLLLKQPGLNFKLRCQQFMEMVTASHNLEYVNVRMEARSQP